MSMAIDLERKEKDEVLDKEAREILKRQKTIIDKFEYLKKIDRQHFQYEFVKSQANEICNYLKDINLSPFKGWINDFKKFVSNADFMEKYFLTYDSFDEVIPDKNRIERLILEEPLSEEEVRASGTMDFE